MEFIVKTITTSKIVTVIAALVLNKSGGTSMRFALVVAAVSIISALVIPMAMEESSLLASFERQNIDTIITGSVKKPKRYTIRKSVLDN